MSRLRAHAPSAAVPLAATALYVLTASRWLVGRSDAAEFAALAARGGVAHPPGYPLYVLWLRAFAWLPLGVAHRASVATALLGGLAIAALQWACRSWGASRSAAAVVAALFAVWRVPWQQATAPEVFAGSVALAMAITAVAGPRALPALRGPPRVALLGLLAGLGLSNQQTIVLLAPLGIWAAVVEAKGAWARAVSSGVVALALGLLPYAYLPYATAHGLPEECVAGDFRSFSSVLHHFLRTEYGTFRLSAVAGESGPGAQLLWLVKDVGTSLLWCPAAIGVPFLGRRSWPTSRGRLLSLVASLVLAGPLFALRMNFPPGTSYLVLAERFHLLPAALLAVLSAALLDGALERAADGLRARALAIAGATLFVTVRVAWVTTDEPWYAPVLERWMANVFRTLPPSAVLFARSDPAIGAFMYARCAEAARPDVALVSPNRLFAPWYAERVARTAGFAYRPVTGPCTRRTCSRRPSRAVDRSSSSTGTRRSSNRPSRATRSARSSASSPRGTRCSTRCGSWRRTARCSRRLPWRIRRRSLAPGRRRCTVTTRGRSACSAPASRPWARASWPRRARTWRKG